MISAFDPDVIRVLIADSMRSGDVVFSLAGDVPDQWYALNSPADGQARIATLTVRAIDFPPTVHLVARVPLSVARRELGLTRSRAPVAACRMESHHRMPAAG